MRCSQLPPQNTDPLLRPFLQTEDEAEAQRLLGQLIQEHARPVVREIAHTRLHLARVAEDGGDGKEAEDVCSEVVLQLLSRLRELRDCPDQAAIANFRGYVAAVAYNSFNLILRRKYPERQRLKNRLRYLMNHDPRFAMWEGANGASLCGLAVWKNRVLSAFPPQHAVAESFVRSLYDTPNLRQLPWRALIDTLFSLSERPIELEELIGLVAKIWSVEDLHRVESGEEDKGETEGKLRDPHVNVDVLVERRLYLAALWKEICELRPLQRAALLLNLHDTSGQDMLPLFILLGVAGMSEISASLDMTMEEFAKLWDSLPLDDAAIAKRMGTARQQVINLRKSARERLARRMAKF